MAERGYPELLDLSLTAVTRLIKRRDVSPVEVVDATLARIASLNPILCAYISVFEEQARQVARAAEMLIMAGHDLGPLHGVPIALKDNVATKGQRTTAGSKILADWLPAHDATVASRLRRAGAVFVGKLNMHEFAWGGTSDNPHYGAVRNPWNTDRFPAGSSGGSGAAVAARACFGAIGTDTGGSIRLPSAVNGIVGLRPTYGRVSNHGIVPLAWSMDTAGPMARTVADCALMFGAFAGHDPADPASANVATHDYLSRLDDGVTGLRIGIVPGYFFHHLQPPVHAAGARRRDGGAEDARGRRCRSGRGADREHPRQHLGPVDDRVGRAEHLSSALAARAAEDYGADVRTLLEVGEMLLATHYLQAQRYRSLLRNEFLEAFKKVDLFLCPTLPFTATPIGATKVVIENGVEEDMLSAIMQYTGVPSLTGLPALAVPCGFDGDGLPVGMQLIGKPFDEATLFRVGAAYQALTGFHLKAPAI